MSSSVESSHSQAIWRKAPILLACRIGQYLYPIRTGDAFQLGAILLTIFAVAPLTYPGFFQSHSGLLPIYNLYDFARRAELGWFPSVAVLGDPLRSGGPLGYAVANAFLVLGASAPGAILASYALSFLIGAWAVYRWLRGWLGFGPALLASVIYTYFPYHIVVVYVRGSLPEAWAFAIWPIVFWAADTWLAGRVMGPGNVAVALLLLGAAHRGLALMTLPCLAAYTWAVGHVSLRSGIVRMAIGLAIPTVVSHFPSRSLGAQFPYLFQFVSPAWSSAGRPGDWLSPLPLQVGLAGLGLGLLCALRLWELRSHLDRSARLLSFWLGAALVIWWLELSLAQMVWQLSGWTSLMTYPWQALGFIALALSVAGSGVVALDRRLQSTVMLAALIVFVVLASYNYLSPRFFDFEINFTPTDKVEHKYVMWPREAPVAVFGDELALLDYRVEGPLRHGATVRLNILWQALTVPRANYVVFVHAVDGSGRIWGQRDVEPKNGEFPTSMWSEGEIVPDRYEFQINPDGPREGYQLTVGLYRKDTGQRLATRSGTEVPLGE